MVANTLTSVSTVRPIIVAIEGSSLQCRKIGNFFAWLQHVVDYDIGYADDGLEESDAYEYPRRL